ncbi:hypothetical protein H109_06465 [Trichophyton interdigitale MR816]|uniref:DUF4484 domain-containing protein n=1 Tax=Trichophyton interdigitale (strain MR816) TaxID=1215338 RepID=A0A059J1N9_TRIIM|nr:hypothetical protein H101_07393 [Trichophyton interdigitale H6]KDB21603.1 hypothetical protein H109_06465 [Trichophyton interdigitale MR816]
MPSDSRPARMDLAFDSPGAPPGIAALFLIRFDIRAGYTIAWKKTASEIVLDNAVEFKSLPSGAHNVKEDLVYFVHDRYIGLSAFINQPAGEAERNAIMLSVGILAPLSHGRLGRSWKHAAGLKELAIQLATDPDDTQPLASYWDKHQLRDSEGSSPPESPLEYMSHPKPISVPPAKRRQRALSDATALISSRTLPSYHPALTLPDFLDTFGPLIFPLYRAALLRKRIVFLGDAPVESSCNFIYNISLLSSLPQNLLSLLPSTKDIPSFRPRPLFNIGIHDMAQLSTLSSTDPCWIACSSDRVLGLRPELYDVLVTLPPNYSRQAPERIYPKMSLSPPAAAGQQKDPKAKSTPIKATQRDSRRFITLRDGLGEFSRLGEISGPDRDDSDNASTFSSSSLVEPISWPLLAYTSFIWWASAGEKGAGPSDEEAEQDAELLQLSSDDTEAVDDHSNPNSLRRRESMIIPDANNTSQEIAIITYFRRLTTRIFTILFDIITRQAEEDLDESPDLSNQSETSSLRRYRDNEGEEQEDDEQNSSTLVGEHDDQPLLRTPEEEEDVITITSSDITNMGLDAWSHADKVFVVELVNVWWGRKAQVEGSHIQCCGVRII